MPHSWCFPIIPDKDEVPGSNPGGPTDNPDVWRWVAQDIAHIDAGVGRHRVEL